MKEEKKMLTKPKNGWTDFSLKGTFAYGLSYLDDIAFEWLDQAIHGLETLSPFCVKGFLEPNRMLCMISYWNCHIIVEDDERRPLREEQIRREYSHTSMIEFCKCLYSDISEHIDAWVSFVDYVDADPEKKRQQLFQKLEKLKELIGQREECFGENRCFL